MAATLAEIRTVQTEAEAFASLLVDLAAEGVSYTGWQSTAVQSALARIAAKNDAAAQAIRLVIVDGGYPNTAARAWLDAVLQGFFLTYRTPARKTVGTFRITDSASVGPLPTKQVGEVRVTYGTPGIVFTNAEAFSVALGGYTDVSFVAEVAGTSGNIPNVSTLAFLTALPGYAVTNPAVGATGTWITVAGAAAELDAAYLARSLARWGALGAGGNEQAVRYRVGVAEPLCTLVGVNDANPNGPGSVDVYLGTATGTASGGNITTVDAYLQPRKAVGTGELRCFAAPTVTNAVTATIYSDGTRASTDIEDDADAAMAQLVADVVVLGGTLYVAELVQRLMDIDGVVNVTIATPAADVDLGLFGRLIDGSHTWTVV